MFWMQASIKEDPASIEDMILEEEVIFRLNLFSQKISPRSQTQLAGHAPPTQRAERGVKAFSGP